MSRTIYLDIETCPLPVAEREFMRPTAGSVKLGNIKDPAKAAAKVNEAIAEFESGADAGLDSLQAQIAMIGFALEDGPVQQLVGEESAILKKFWYVVSGGGFADSETEIVGHNIRFDAAMLVHRSWLRGVAPSETLVRDLCKRYPAHWLDTMTRWQLGDNKAEYRSLQVLCAAFGIAVKESPVKAARFWEWWDKDRAACLAYNAQDVEAVRQLWSKIK